MKINLKNILLLLAVFALVSLVVSLIINVFLTKPEPTPTSKNQTIEVANYSPQYIPKNSKVGSCWLGSIADSSSPTAYRCMVGDTIYDPCFENKTNQVVCINDPEKPEESFILKLTAPLPDNSSRSERNDPWVFTLENGFKCWMTTGPADEYNNTNSFYECNNTKIHPIGNIDKSQPFWKVNIVYTENSGDHSGKEEVHIITKTWR